MTRGCTTPGAHARPYTTARGSILGIAGALVAMLLVALPALAQERPRPTVGMVGKLGDLVLPGPELEARPLERKDVVVLRVTACRPHGDAFRYDLEFYALEPGRHDLANYLRRVNGSAEPVPPIEVEVLGVLPPGLVLPHEPAPGALPAVGGYRRVLVAVGVAWLVGLLALWRVGRTRAAAVARAKAAGPSLRERLTVLVAEAQRGTMSPERQAELERLVIAGWRERLGLTEGDAAEAMAKLRAHPKAGAHLARLDGWLHRPADRRVALDPSDLGAVDA